MNRPLIMATLLAAAATACQLDYSGEVFGLHIGEDAGSTNPCEIDSDRDGIPDCEDYCPYQFAPELPGCPTPDPAPDASWPGYDASASNLDAGLDSALDPVACSDVDTDQDGINDCDDLCVEDAEDYDGIQDGDGCPETDADLDGVPDEQDMCPELAEDIDGHLDGDGCPEGDEPSPSVDAGMDAGVGAGMDAGVDAAVGTGADAAMDASI